MPVSKRNKRGIVWILLLGMIIALSPRLYTYFFVRDELTISFTELKEKENELVQRGEEVRKKTASNKKSRFLTPKNSFDPNELKKEDWLGLGLSAKQADVVMRFTERGIRNNEELHKIFVIPEELYQLIKDSTFYPKQAEKVVNRDIAEKREPLVVDLATCNQEDLVKIPGIGDFFGRKIIEYREQLGGYISVDQLTEVWKMDEEKVNAIRPFLVLDKPVVQQIDLNSATVESLKKHPYISYSVANSIVKMREQNGEFKKVEEIKRSKLIDQKLYDKLYPYLKVE